MRSILVAALVLSLAMVPAAQAQQAVPPAATEPTPTSLMELVPHWSQTASADAPAMAADLEHRSGAASAAREPSARTLLAVVGAAVLVIALVALVR